MITGLPADFTAALASTRRKPVQLAKITVDTTDYYVGDKYTVVDGHTYEPWVESWGELVDNSEIENLFGGQSLGIRTCNITLIVSAASKAFVLDFIGAGIENTRVELYQWFAGMTSPPVLIDKFICQDPISISEGSMLFSIDLVSPLAGSNRTLCATAAGENLLPIVIGSVEGLPLIDMDSAPTVRLAQDLKFDEGGWVDFEMDDRWPTTGTMQIDEEHISYTGKSDTQIYIGARGVITGGIARPHSIGALAYNISESGLSYEYHVCAGPVSLIDNVTHNGVPIPVSYFTSIVGNPAFVRFNDPPILSTAPGRASSVDVVSHTAYEGYSVQSGMIDGITYHPLSVGYGTGEANRLPDLLNPAITWRGCYGYVPRTNIPHSPADIQFKVTLLVTAALTSGDPVDVYVGTALQSVGSPLPGDVTVEGGVTVSVPGLESEVIEVVLGTYTRQEIIDLDYFVAFYTDPTAGVSEFIVLAEYKYEYQTEENYTPEEMVTTYITDMRCDVTGILGADVTPPELVQTLIQDSGTGSVVDSADFAAEITRYSAGGYYFNGILPAGIKTHEAIKEALTQGLGRLKYNQGEIQFLSYFDDDDTVIDKEITTLDNVRLRSRSIENYSTDNIKNDITVLYDYDVVTGAYTEKVEADNPQSINRFLRKYDTRELSLISDSAVATRHVNRMLAFLKDAPSVFSIYVYLPDGYVLEKGDKIHIPDFLTDSILQGNILSITRTFGQGKNEQMNIFKLMISHYSYLKRLLLTETIAFDDSLIELPRVLSLSDQITFSDFFSRARILTMELAESVVVDDSGLSMGSEITLVIPTESIVMDDLTIDKSACSGYGSCGYGAAPYGQ